MFEANVGKICAVRRPPQGCNFSVTLLETERGRFIVKTGESDGQIADWEREAFVLRGLTACQPLVPQFVARGREFFPVQLSGGD